MKKSNGAARWRGGVSSAGGYGDGHVAGGGSIWHQHQRRASLSIAAAATSMTYPANSGGVANMRNAASVVRHARIGIASCCAPRTHHDGNSGSFLPQRASAAYGGIAPRMASRAQRGETSSSYRGAARHQRRKQ